jgi:hypothetical protein
MCVVKKRCGIKKNNAALIAMAAERVLDIGLSRKGWKAGKFEISIDLS